MHADSDIDVFAPGEGVDDLDTPLLLGEGTLEAWILLSREVNVRRYTREKLEGRHTGGFLSSVPAGPRTWLIGNHRALSPGGGAS